MAHDSDAQQRSERIAALAPPQGFDPAPALDDVLTRVFVHHMGRRGERHLQTLWQEGQIDLYAGDWSRPAARSRSVSVAAEAEPGDVLMIEGFGWEHGERVHRRPPLRVLVIARLASIVPTDRDLRVHVTAYRAMRDVPRDALPAGVPEALHRSANSSPFLRCVRTVLHPAFAPERQ